MQKQINPVSIWINGTSKDAAYLSLISTRDNLQSEAVFHYGLMGENVEVVDLNQNLPDVNDGTVTPPAPNEKVSLPGELLVEGNLTLSSDEYSLWDGTNEWILSWAANKLNVTLI